MRVIAGTARGHRLVGPPEGAATRPTSDKVREAIFNVVGSRVDGARVVDLFAGTGALGIESLSRGARMVVFVERDRLLCTTIRKNLDIAKVANRAIVLCRDVRRAHSALQSNAPFDLALLDPPYAVGLEQEAFSLILRDGLLAPEALIALEHGSRAPPVLAPEITSRLTVVRVKEYGDTAVTYYQPNESKETS